MITIPGHFYWNKIAPRLEEISRMQNEEEKQDATLQLTIEVTNEYSRGYSFIIGHIKEINSQVVLLESERHLMDALKESLFCYVNGQYLATIACVGITAELLTVTIYHWYLEQLKINPEKIEKRIEKFSDIRQAERIDTLFSIAGMDEGFCQRLHSIRDIRNKNVHPHNDKEYKTDALSCMKNLFFVVNAYSATISNMLTEAEIKRREEETKS